MTEKRASIHPNAHDHRRLLRALALLPHAPTRASELIMQRRSLPACQTSFGTTDARTFDTLSGMNLTHSIWLP